MPWGLIIAAGISAYSASRQRRAARDAQGNANDATDQQAQIAREQLQFGRDVYNDWRQRFGPVGDAMIAEAMREPRIDYEAIASDNANAFEAQRGANTRRLERFGINPSDGMYAGDLYRSGNAEALSHVQNRNAARRGQQQQRFANLNTAYAAGSGLPSTAQNFMASGSAGFGQAAGAYNNYANQSARDGAAQASAIGDMFMTAWNGIRGSGGGGGGGSSYGPYSSGYQYPAGTPGTGAWGGTNWGSSVTLKENIKPNDGSKALEIIKRTPVFDWNYKGDAQGKVGPVAEIAPPEISPDGVSQDPQNTVNLLMAAVQELARRMDVGNRKMVRAA